MEIEATFSSGDGCVPTLVAPSNHQRIMLRIWADAQKVIKDNGYTQVVFDVENKLDDLGYSFTGCIYDLARLHIGKDLIFIRVFVDNGDYHDFSFDLALDEEN